MKIVYIGSSTALSYITLRGLIESGHAVDSVAVASHPYPAPHNPKLPLFIEHSYSLESLASLHDIPLIRLTGNWSETFEQLARISPEVILVCCFGGKLPDNIVSIPRYGCFNLHPSLLPSFRGPAPVFWQFRAGAEVMGVSLHCVSAEFDAGDIVAQTRVSVPDGADGRQVQYLLAQSGSQLIETTLDAIAHGCLQPRTQSSSEVSYQGFPRPKDYAVSPLWTARRIYNFICATRAPGIEFPCEVDGKIYRLVSVLSFWDEGGTRTAVKGNRISINCNPGVVEAVYAG